MALKKFQVPMATRGRHQNKANFPSTQLYGGPRNMKYMSGVSDMKHSRRFRRGVDAYFTSVHRLSQISWSKKNHKNKPSFHGFWKAGSPATSGVAISGFLPMQLSTSQSISSRAVALLLLWPYFSEESQLAVWP